MKKNKYCQKLPQDCLSVSLETDEWNPQKMCSLKFSDAICTKDDCKKDAGKCKKALKTDAKKRLSVFCPTVCDMRCGKINITLDCIVRGQFFIYLTSIFTID